MVNQGPTKIYQSNGRRYLYIPSNLAEDDRFPFKAKEPLTIKIQGDQLVVEKAKGKG